MSPYQAITLPLPAEIQDHIIDHLYDDLSSLKAGTLVCHAWLGTCHFHLFYTTLCHPGKPGRTIQDMILWSRTHPDVALYVRELFISGPALDILSIHSMDTVPEVIVEDIEQLLRQIPAIRSMSFIGIRLSSRMRQDETLAPTTIRTSLREPH
ncbi:hypothetical protein C8Q80DRAFT_174602 [Daedaleopsis nitida]|nr:hypothetical protein C8Q80DRAFT_174602 [Daedaleopsis nitida]